MSGKLVQVFFHHKRLFQEKLRLMPAPAGSTENPGLGSRLSVLRREGRRAKPTCACAVRWFEAHPEEQDLLA